MRAEGEVGGNCTKLSGQLVPLQGQLILCLLSSCLESSSPKASAAETNQGPDSSKQIKWYKSQYKGNSDQNIRKQTVNIRET